MLCGRILLGDQMTVYVDVIFLENIIINYIILYVTGIISKTNIKQLKILLGSIIGATYAIIYYILNLKIYSSFIIKIVLSIIIIYVSFNPKKFKILFKQVILFYLISFVFAGATIGIIYMVNFQNITIQNGVLVGNYTIRTILIGIIIAYFLVMIGEKIIKTKFSKKDMICDIEVSFENKKIKTKALIDTGNMLKEPITNTSVIVLEYTLLYDIIPKPILDNLENILGGDLSKIPKDLQTEYISKFRVIPFSSLGKQNGILLGVKGENLIVNINEEMKKIDKVIIGIYNKPLTKNGEYKGLLGLEILN